MADVVAVPATAKLRNQTAICSFNNAGINNSGFKFYVHFGMQAGLFGSMLQSISQFEVIFAKS
jgi:hypothetical protein